MKLSDFCRPVALAACVWTVSAGTASAAVQPYLGEIMYTAANFCPPGWTEARGQTLEISSNSALFATIQTSFGGNGTTTFNLPDLRSRVVVGTGVLAGAGLTPRSIGQVGGSETVTLTPSNTPTLRTSSSAATEVINFGSGDSESSRTVLVPAGSQGSTPTNLLGLTTGANLPVNIVPPHVALTACIATTGTFPVRQ